jgi:hypothetical protein
VLGHSCHDGCCSRGLIAAWHDHPPRTVTLSFIDPHTKLQLPVAGNSTSAGQAGMPHVAVHAAQVAGRACQRCTWCNYDHHYRLCVQQVRFAWPEDMCALRGRLMPCTSGCIATIIPKCHAAHHQANPVAWLTIQPCCLSYHAVAACR